MLCRLCIFQCDEEEAIDVIVNKNETDLNKLILKYLGLEIKPDDGISTNICLNCSQNLKNFDEFVQHVEKQQNVIQLIYLRRDEAERDQMQLEENAYEDQNVKIPVESLEFVATLENGKQQKELEQTTCKAAKGNLNNIQQNANEVKSKDLEFKKSQAELTAMNEKFIEQHVQLKCKVCGATLATFKDFQRHFRIKHDAPAYIKCCGVRFYSKQRMVKHIQSHVNPDLFKCQICNKVLSGPNNLKSHIASFHTDKDKLQHACNICGDRFTTSFILKTHMIVHQEGNKVTCDICNKSFKHLNSAQRHKRMQHGKISYHVCELCGKSYKYKQMFEEHMADKHNIILKDTMKYCSECRSWFSTKYYSKHEERHKLKDVPCHYCSKMLPSKAALDKHLDGHYHKKKCQSCGVSFNFAKELRDHMKSHERPESD